MVPRAPSLSLLAGQVVGLYSRFDVIVSTLSVCMSVMNVAPPRMPGPMQTHPMCSGTQVPVHICPVHPRGLVSPAVTAQGDARTC